MKLDKENNKIYVEGTLTKLNYAPLITKDASGKERASKESYYQISVLTALPDQETRDYIKSTYYKDVEDGFIPKWLKDPKANDNGNIYVNFKSLYDLRYFVPTDGEYTRMSYDDVTEGGAPLGSEVVVSVRCKEGALYADAIKFLRLKSISVDDYFS